MMFGHLGLAYGARAADSDIPLPWLFVAALVPDIIDLGLASRGVCNPGGAYTHGLLPIAITAAVFGAAEAVRSRRWRSALVIAALVLSHVAADYLTGLKALWLGGPLIGLDIYRWGLVDFAAEAVVLIACVWSARKWGRLPRWQVGWTALGLLLVAQLLADEIPARSTEMATAASCAKAGIIQDLPRMI